MTKTDFNTIVQRRTELIHSVLNSKGNEYAMDTDAFDNFKSGVNIAFADTPEKVAWEYMTKHLQSIKSILNNVANDSSSTPSIEVIEEKIGDAINYLILIEGMLKEKRECQTQG